MDWKRVMGDRIQWIDTPVSEHVETCAKGLSEYVDGRTVASSVEKCDKYEEK